MVRLLFWRGLRAIFIKNVIYNATTVNGERSLNMIQVVFWQQIEDMDLDELRFQQDEDTCHTAEERLTLLTEKFSKLLISGVY